MLCSHNMCKVALDVLQPNVASKLMESAVCRQEYLSHLGAGAVQDPGAEIVTGKVCLSFCCEGVESSVGQQAVLLHWK